MKIQVDRSRVNRIIIICEGKLDHSTVIQVEETISLVIKENHLPIVLDLARINHLTDTGVKCLEKLFKLSKEIHGDKSDNNVAVMLRIGDMSSEVRDLLRLKGLLLSMTHPFLDGEICDRLYEDELYKIRQFFPSPLDDYLQNVQFSQLINRSLTHFDKLKTTLPFYGNREALNYEAIANNFIPQKMSNLEVIVDDLSDYLQGHFNFANPKVQKNIISSVTIASIVAQIISSLGNANLVSEEYSHRFAEAEVEIVSICANLIGYNPTQARGFFTFGGTATILYAIKVGIEKAIPEAFSNGIREDAKIICSDVAHYANLSVAAWLGLGTKNLVTIPTDPDNSMNLEVLEDELQKLLNKKQKIAAIIATMGTTDAFGIDNLELIVKLRDKLVKQYHLDYKPHIHADAVIGWIFSVFNDYDFKHNPMGFIPRTLQSLSDTNNKLKFLYLADSTGIDFHKTGYTNYNSSAILFRDKTDLSLISRNKKDMPYIFNSGHYHPGYFTLETSRSSSPPMTALANLKLLGKEGYQIILGHLVTMAGRIRSKIERVDNICVVNDYNYGSVTLFRIYPNGVNAKVAYWQEIKDSNSREQLRTHNEYNRQIFTILKQQVERGYGIVLSLTERYRTTFYGEPIVALKSYLMSPFTDVDIIEKLFSCLEEACLEIK
jgi:glutamate/tyrosine decarboxylase-like PLP-dependent enzyme/anti-anti-sigma regulatory factor